jgi:hypothetical protein
MALVLIQAQPRLHSEIPGAPDDVFTACNPGRRAGNQGGKDVVQLHLSDLVASVTPPVRELVRFAKVDLAPGETERLSFTLSAEDLSFIGRDEEPVVEPGTFRVRVDSLPRSIDHSPARSTWPAVVSESGRMARPATPRRRLFGSAPRIRRPPRRPTRRRRPPCS